MPYTMSEVARRAGVSLATVSRVLNNTQYISEETRARVLKAVREFNYFKNVHFRRLATGRSDSVRACDFRDYQSELSGNYSRLSGDRLEQWI